MQTCRLKKTQRNVKELVLLQDRVDRILRRAAQHRLPTVYPYRYFVTAGGLACYGPDTIGQYRAAATYVDRILRGEKPADMPVQAPTKYELVRRAYSLAPTK